MKAGSASVFLTLAVVVLLATESRAGDWSQWLGSGRDGRATGFKAPDTWPKELTKKWSVEVGSAVATPALVGDKLYVFARENGNEVTRCLEAATGKEVWKDSYEAPFRGGADGSYPGPRSSPAVADGKVVTFGVNGDLSCLNAADGKKLWRVDTGDVPRFHTSSSPIIANGLAIAQYGSDRSGGIVAYELATGKEKWKWSGEGPGYASLATMTVDGTQMVVAMTSASVVGVSLADGKELWKTDFAGRGRSYNAATPMVTDNNIVVISGNGGRGTKAVQIEKSNSGFSVKDLWTSPQEYSVIYNTPIVKDGHVYGLSEREVLYCLSLKDGKVAWEQQFGSGGGRGGGYGSIVDAGSVLMAVSPGKRMVFFQPSAEDFKEVAAYDVPRTYAYPIISGNTIYIKGGDSNGGDVTMFTLD